MTESSRLARVLKAEMTESSRVPRLLKAEMTESSRVPRALKSGMSGTQRYWCSDYLVKDYKELRMRAGCRRHTCPGRSEGVEGLRG